MLLVVWVVVLLSVLVSGLGARMLMALGFADRLEGQLRTRAVAVGGVHYAAAQLSLDPTPDADGLREIWSRDEPRFHDQPLGIGSFTIIAPADLAIPSADLLYGLVVEVRRIKVNTAPPGLLQRLCRFAGGVSEDESLEIAEAIADWRDEDQRARPHGAEDFYYLGLAHPYPSKDCPFENAEELLLVKGITPELFARLEPFVTVHGSGSVNINTAGHLVLAALGLTPAGVAALLDYRAGEDGREGSADDHVLTAIAAISGELSTRLPAEDVSTLIELSAGNVVGVGSEAFRFIAIGNALPGDLPMRITCVMDRNGTVRSWEER